MPEKVTTERVTASEEFNRIVISLETWEGSSSKSRRFVASLAPIGKTLRSDHTPTVRKLRKYLTENYDE